MEFLLIVPVYLIALGVGILLVRGASALLKWRQVSPETRAWIVAILSGLLCAPAPAAGPHILMLLPAALALLGSRGDATLIGIALGSTVVTATGVYLIRERK